MNTASYPACEFLVIDRPAADGSPSLRIGRLLSILGEGLAAGLPASIHVETNNPAMSLHARLGFRHVDTNGVYHLMQWEAASGT